MNVEKPNLQIIKNILKMGAAGEVSIPERFGLVSEEFNQYRDYLLKRHLANEITDDKHSHFLQPTPAGYALVRIIDKLDSVSENDEESHQGPGAEECLPMPISSDRVTTVKLLRNKLLQAYILEQAEITRLEAQLRYAESNGELIEEVDVMDIIEEFKEHERRFSMLKDFLKVLPNLLGKSQGR